jgi:glutamate-1-semialdehyde 2,1-aminomutase
MSSSLSSSPSAALYERAKKVLPGGVSRNTVLRQPHPLYAQRGVGCRVTDIEGVERIDFANNMASLIHGHAHPEVVAAVTAQLERGSCFTLGTEAEIVYAELMCERFPSFDQIRFVNSGTEAVMGCLKASRAFTGRPRIAKVEGAYHGLYDYAEVSQTADPNTWGPIDHPASVPVARGTPVGALGDVVIIPFNDTERTLRILDEHPDDLAAILMDPMPHRVGLTPATPAYVSALRRWCDEHGTLLVFDEVITLRSTYRGAQDWFDVKPDLTAMGKMIGGGFPVGALAGRADVMCVMNPLTKPLAFPHSGTFSANPITMVAGYTSMRLFDVAAVERLNALADRARRQITEAIEIAGVSACVTGAGSMFRVHMQSRPPSDYRSCWLNPHRAKRMNLLLDYLFEHGCMMINTCSATLSTAMTEQEIDRLSETMLGGFRLLASQGAGDDIP